MNCCVRVKRFCLNLYLCIYKGGNFYSKRLMDWFKFKVRHVELLFFFDQRYINVLELKKNSILFLIMVTSDCVVDCI